MLLKKDGPKDLYNDVKKLEKTARWTRISKYIQDQGPRITTVLDLSKVSLKDFKDIDPSKKEQYLTWLNKILPNITDLRIRNQNLSQEFKNEFYKNFFRWEKLQIIELEKCQIESLDFLEKFSEIKQLNLVHNKIREYPKGRFKVLEYLDLSYNELRNKEKTLEDLIHTSTSCTEINLVGNPNLQLEGSFDVKKINLDLIKCSSEYSWSFTNFCYGCTIVSKNNTEIRCNLPMRHSFRLQAIGFQDEEKFWVVLTKNDKPFDATYKVTNETLTFECLSGLILMNKDCQVWRKLKRKEDDTSKCPLYQN